MSATTNAKLSLADIADLRAYERERDAFRDEIIALKKIRRISVGPIITLVFENRDTIRFQIQEMVRAERMLTDEAVQTELDTYNPLIPAPGELRATMFIELTSKDELMTWLPKLVGIETSIWLEVGDPAEPIRCDVDEAHASQLTRDEITASVHYLGWHLTPDQVARFAEGPVALAVRHEAYEARTPLTPEATTSLLADLTGRAET